MATSTIQYDDVDSYEITVATNVYLRFKRVGRIVSVSYNANGTAITQQLSGSIPDRFVPSTPIGFAINGDANNYCVIGSYGYRVRCDDSYGNGSTAYVV